jgi:hypothetical protein
MINKTKRLLRKDDYTPFFYLFFFSLFTQITKQITFSKDPKKVCTTFFFTFLCLLPFEPRDKKHICFMIYKKPRCKVEH